MKRTGIFRTTALVSCVLTSQALAADDGLYQDVFDPNSSFIRVLAPDQSFASIDGKTLNGLEFGLSSYVNVMPGSVDVVMSAANATVTVEPSRHYTVLYTDGGEATILEDTVVQSPSKSDVMFYNLTDKPDVDLYVPAAKVTAIDGVTESATKSVAIKAPLTLDFEVREDDSTLASVQSVALKRKAGVSLILVEQDGFYSVSAVPNAYAQ